MTDIFKALMNRRWAGNVMVLVVVSFVTLFVIRSFVFGNGFPYTHDGENHLARFMNFTAALREGQFPPRFAPYIAHGFGFPVFNYNYPLANILAVPLLVLGLSPGQSFTLIGGFAVVAGALAVYALLRRGHSSLSSLVGAVWFASSSYLASAWVFRGSIGEILAYSLIPIVVVAFQKSLREKRNLWSIFTVATLSLFFLSHNVTVLLAAPFLLVWSFSLASETKHFKRFVSTWLASLGLVAWFWIPAVMELSLIVLRSDSLAQSAASHILSVSQFFFAPLRFGFSRPSLVDSLGFGLGWGSFIVAVLLLSLLVTEALHFKKRLSSHGKRALWLLAAAGVLSFILATQLSTFLWESVPQLAIIQFPWRWQLVFTLVLVVGMAQLWQRGSTLLRFILLMCLILNFRWIAYLQPADYVQHANDHYLSFPHTTTTRNENRPKTLSIEDLGSWSPNPIVSSGTAEIVSVESWLGSKRSYTVRVHEDTIIEEPTVYFPGWVTRDQRGERYTYDLSSTAKGLIRYRLLAREEPYSITTEFTEKTPPRLIGEGITLITAVALVGYMLWEVRRK